MEAKLIVSACLLAFILGIGSRPLYAQDMKIEDINASRPIISSIEIFGGSGHSYYRGDKFPTDQVLNLSWSGGVGVTHFFNNRFEINAKILLERKGYKEDYIQTFFDSNNNSSTSRYVQGLKLDYATLSFTPRIFIGTKNHFHVGLGGYISFLRKAANYTEQYSLDGSQISNYYADAVGEFKDTDFGLSSSVGYQKEIKSNIYFTSQLMFNLGFQDIRNPSQPAFPFKNNIMSILLGLKLISNA